MTSRTEILGSVLGQGRHTDEILVVTTLAKAGSLRRGAILAHDTARETILLQVAHKLTWTDVSEQDIHLMGENEDLALRILQRSPKSFILRCTIVGAIRDDGGGAQIFSGATRFIAERTTEVRSLTDAERRQIYDRGTLAVGQAVDGSPVSLPVNPLLQRHLSLIGMTGCGKSYLLGLLCEELMQHQAALVVLDPHNEYVPMAQSLPRAVDRRLYSVGRLIGLIPYTLDVKRVTAYDFQHFTGMGRGSTSIVESVLRGLRETSSPYTVEDILGALEQRGKTGDPSEQVAAIWARNYIQNLANTGLIGTSEPAARELVNANQMTVIAMSGVKTRIQQFVATSILQKLFEARQRGDVPPLVLVVEEAHRFAPAAETVASSEVVRTLAAEGRKFGICLIVVSQRPNRLDATVLSQCVSNIVMKMKNPHDLASVRESAENITDEVLDELPTFEKGEALIMGEAFPIPLRFKTRSDRRTRHGGESVDFVDAWRVAAAHREVKHFEFPSEV